MPNEARKAFIQTIFNAFGVNEKDWTTIDQLRQIFRFIEYLPKIEASLPKSIVGNLKHLSQADERSSVGF